MSVRWFQAILVCTAMLGGTAHAATVEDVAQGFRSAVVTDCALSVAFDVPLTKWSAETLSGLSLTTDPQAREFMNAGPDDVVWDVIPGKGSIFLLQEPSGNCRVMGYGPPIQPVFDATVAAMQDPPYTLEKMPPLSDTDGIDTWLKVQINGQTLVIELHGYEAGSSGNGPPFNILAGFVSKPAASP